MWMGEGGSASCRCPDEETTDITLSSSDAKKLACFAPKFRLRTKQKSRI